MDEFPEALLRDRIVKHERGTIFFAHVLNRITDFGPGEYTGKFEIRK